jgi:hypothetical protein
LVALVLLGLWAINHYFGPTDTGSKAIDSGGSSGNQIAPATPAGLQGTVGLFYKHVAHNSPDNACNLFADDGRARKEFADAVGARDCQSAVRKLHDQVTDVSGYEMPGFTPEMTRPPTGQTVEISSCAMTVRGGPVLGRFTLRRQQNDTWIISGYATETCGTSSAPTS